MVDSEWLMVNSEWGKSPFGVALREISQILSNHSNLLFLICLILLDLLDFCSKSIPHK